MINSLKKKIRLAVLFLGVIVAPLMLSGCDKPEEVTISLSSVSETNKLQPGQSLQFVSEVSSEELGMPFYQIIEGSEYASISATGLVTINQDAPRDSVIKVRSSIGKIVSNVYEITVEVIDVTSVSISHTRENNNLERGQEIILSAEVLPSNATYKGVTFEITKGEGYASVTSSGLLKVNADADLNAEIKVVAKNGDIVSNTLVFKVIETPESEFDVILSEDNIVLDATSSQPSRSLLATAFDVDQRIIKDAVFTYDVIEGPQFVFVSSTGALTPKGHGEAVVRVKVVGSNAYTEARVNSIMPPRTISLPSEIEAKTNYGFGQAYPLNFAIEGNGVTVKEGTSFDYDYDFYVNEVLDNTIATFDEETKTIEFSERAISEKVTIRVTSNTGASIETSTSFTLNVNDGINIYSMADVKALNIANNRNFVDASGINFIGDAILQPLNMDDKLLEVQEAPNYYLKFYGDATIYGNGHTYDISNLDWYYDVYEFSDALRDKSALAFYNHKHETVLNPTINRVNIFDLTVKGKATVDADYGYPGGERKDPGKVGFESGILIEATKRGLVDNYYAGTGAKPKSTILTMNNVHVSGFQYGAQFEYVIDSKVSNSSFGNCFEEGAITYQSIMTFENVVFGKAGTVGLEVSPDANNYAGIDFNRPQEIIFIGSVESENFNKFDTKFILGQRASYEPLYQLANLLAIEFPDYADSIIVAEGEEQGAINVALLLFNNPDYTNQSRMKFGEDLEDNSVDITEMQEYDITNTKYLRLHLLPKYGLPYDMGVVYLINNTYTGN